MRTINAKTARIEIYSQYYDTDGEPADDDYGTAEVLQVEDITGDAIYDRLKEIYRLRELCQRREYLTITPDDIDNWLRTEADELPLSVCTEDYVPCANSDDFVGTEETFVQVEKLEDFIEMHQRIFDNTINNFHTK